MLEASGADRAALLAEHGSPPTFEEFYASVADRLFGALCLITHDRHEAEELAQDALVRVWERWDRVGRMADPAGYLFRTAMNGFRKGLRRRALVRVFRGPRDVAGADPVAAVEARHDVQRALATLPVRQRAALVLTDLLGFRSEEASEMLGVKPVTVRVLASQANAALREAMGERDG
jgi:RNA polymerase sigma-70 factor (ECF subfamily)